jgi:hypothetical protein
MRLTEMTREQRLFLVNLNNRLFEIEQHLKKEALAIIDTMEKRIEEGTDWINYYVVKCKVGFYLNENDPAYSDKECNLQAELIEGVGLRMYKNHSFLASADNWNDRGIPDIDDPDKDEHHCWFYHQLYDHAKLSWENILRIGDIWVDINLILQHHLKLP